jgi:hypothetical protein
MMQTTFTNTRPNLPWFVWFMIFGLLVGLVRMVVQEYSSDPNEESGSGSGASQTGNSEGTVHRKRSMSIQEETAIRAIKDVMVNDLYNLAAVAYQYRLRPNSMGGGQGSYAGFTVPKRMRSNANATFEVQVISTNLVKLTGVSTQYGSNSIIVHVDEKGDVSSWGYTGDFLDL